MRTPKANDFIEVVLRQQNEDLGKKLGGDVLLIKSSIRFGLDDAVKLEVERLCEKVTGKQPKLIVVLQTTGGYIETVERIYDVFRNHYNEVDFIVPNYAYSAGTVLVLSGDNIYMDYYSVLGPIDPQIENDDGKLVPGLGYLAKYQELMDIINQAKPGGKQDCGASLLDEEI